MNTTRIILGGLWVAVSLSACQPQSPSTSADLVTMAEAHAICSTLAVARNTPDFNLLDQVLAPDVVTNDPFSQAPMTNLEQLKQFYLGTQTGFPDFSMRYDDLWVDGDNVIAHWTAAATHKGQWYGLEGTGKNVTISGLSVMTIADGKITEQASYFDLLSVAEQLGARLTMGDQQI